MPPITILIADDHASTRATVRMILEMEDDLRIVGEVDNGLTALRAVRTLIPNIVLMDHHMPLADGLETTRQIKARWPQVRVVFLAGEENGRQDAYRVGAEAFLLKDSPPDVLVSTIRAVAQGQPALLMSLAV
ncbi:MAG: response regulator transcription factor [Chloroflexi bacterium]|nr:response regulator transcription factor [Chloroflexota bacterium]MBU1747335.1 response regulator transcription factor [Chloroflexota bacterium]